VFAQSASTNKSSSQRCAKNDLATKDDLVPWTARRMLLINHDGFSTQRPASITTSADSLPFSASGALRQGESPSRPKKLAGNCYSKSSALFDFPCISKNQLHNHRRRLLLEHVHV
jgi:hypothetical protein